MKFSYWTLVPIVVIGLSGFGWLALWLMPAVPARKSDITLTTRS